MITDIIPYRNKDLWGYADSDKEILIPCKFERAEPFSENRAIVRDGSLWGLIDTAGNYLCNPKYDYIESFTNGFARVKINDKWGFINSDGYEVIPLIYDGVLPFSEQIAAVKMNGKYGFIDKHANPITKINYDLVDSFKNGYASIMENDLFGCIDKNGVEVIPCISGIVVDFSEELAAVSLINHDEKMNSTAEGFSEYNPGKVSLEYKYGIFDKLIDQNGNVFEPEQLRLSSQNHKCGYVNIKREVVIPFLFDIAFPFKESVACICINKLYGFINKSGDLVIKNIYQDAGDFSEGLAKVMINGKWGYINKSGDEVISPRYEKAFDFVNGIAKVEFNLSGDYIHRFIDKNGNELNFPTFYSNTNQTGQISYFVEDYFSENVIACSDDSSGRFYYIDSDGAYVSINQETLNVNEYDITYPFENGIALVGFYKDGTVYYGYIDRDGSEYWEPNEKIV